MKKLSILLALLLAACLASSAAAEAGYPIAGAEGQTLKVYVVNKVPEYIQNYSESPFCQALEKATGVHVEWEHPAASGISETMNLLFLDPKSLPDIIMCGDLYNGGAFLAVEEGYYVDLSAYLPEYAPDYWALITSSEEAYREVANKDGVIATFHPYKPVPDPAYQYLMFRQDILDQLGVGLPTTLPEFEDVFQKMLDNGITPYSAASSGYEQQIMGAFGVSNGFYLNEAGEIVYGLVQEGFRSYLELMHSWYEKGYLSHDFIGDTTKTRRTAYDTGLLGTYVDAVVATYNRGAAAGFTAVSAPFFRLEKDQQLHWYDYNINPVVFHDDVDAAITTNCKNVELAVQWLNYCYTEAGALLANWGVEGEAFTYDAEGNKVFTDLVLNNENLTTTDASYYYKMHVWPKLTEPDVVCHADLLKSPGALNSRLAWKDDPHVDSDMVLPTLNYSAEDNETRAALMSEINTYADEMTLKFITGEASLDGFDDFTATIWNLGLQDVLDIVNNAYAEYESIALPQ